MDQTWRWILPTEKFWYGDPEYLWPQWHFFMAISINELCSVEHGPTKNSETTFQTWTPVILFEEFGNNRSVHFHCLQKRKNELVLVLHVWAMFHSGAQNFEVKLIPLCLTYVWKSEKKRVCLLAVVPATSWLSVACWSFSERRPVV